ncbi:MAG: DUF1653 domain-containing protein [Oscillospiraceae bacterium]|nr:DUF1653 domain-containing protein [Oscillospiraceae bacterium]
MNDADTPGTASETPPQVLPGRVYRHFKGRQYYVKDVATHSETREIYVVYQALYGDYATFVRPLAMFAERIDASRGDNVTRQTYRFELCDA